MDSQKELALRLQTVIDTAIDCIVTINQRGIIETVNPATTKLFGYSNDEMIGNNVSMLMPSPHRQNHDQYIGDYIKTKRPQVIGIGREVNGLKKDGTTFPIRLAVSEVILHDRIVFTGIIHDLTEVVAAQNKVLQLNKDLEKKVTLRTNELEGVVLKLKDQEYKLKKALAKEKELNELKSKFVAMTSHEFRTPLTSILSSASLIGRYTQEDQQTNRDHHINKIKSAVTTLTGVLNDFLSLARLEENKIQPHYEECNLYSIIRDVREDLQGILKPNQDIICQQSETKHIYTDKQIIKNILFNLLSNAVKYSEKNINCTVEYYADSFSIEIKDQGIGIPLADQKRLFSRFHRAQNVAHIQGTGLGLTIVQQYVSLLRGKLSYKSTEGVGSTFWITIPYNDEKDIIDRG